MGQAPVWRMGSQTVAKLSREKDGMCLRECAPSQVQGTRMRAQTKEVTQPADPCVSTEDGFYSFQGKTRPNHWAEVVGSTQTSKAKWPTALGEVIIRK